MTRYYITPYEEPDAPSVMRNECKGAGRLTRINDWLDGTVGIQYAHDALGRLINITDYDYNKELSYTYDAAGRIASMTDYNGHVTNYTWTARGQLASITAPGSRVWSFQYNALGQHAQYTHPKVTRTEYAYSDGDSCMKDKPQQDNDGQRGFCGLRIEMYGVFRGRGLYPRPSATPTQPSRKTSTSAGSTQCV